MPLQPGKMPTWTRGKHSISHRSNHRAARAGGSSRQPSVSKSSKVTYCSFGKYYCAVLAFLLGGMHSCDCSGVGKQGLKSIHISVASSTLSKNVCGTMESRKSSTRAVFWCGLLLLITDLGSPALLVVTHQCPLIKHRHGFSYHNLHGLCCTSSWSHFLLWKWIPTVCSHSIRPIINA